MLETSTNGAGPADDAAAGCEDQGGVAELGFGASGRAAPAGVRDPELVDKRQQQTNASLQTEFFEIATRTPAAWPVKSDQPNPSQMLAEKRSKLPSTAAGVVQANDGLPLCIAGFLPRNPAVLHVTPLGWRSNAHRRAQTLQPGVGSKVIFFSQSHGQNRPTANLLQRFGKQAGRQTTGSETFWPGYLLTSTRFALNEICAKRRWSRRPPGESWAVLNRKDNGSAPS